MSGQQHAPAAFYSEKDAVPILQGAGWTPGPVWTGESSRLLRNSIPDRPLRSQSLYRLSYRAHNTSEQINLNEREVVMCVSLESNDTHFLACFVPRLLAVRTTESTPPYRTTFRLRKSPFFFLPQWTPPTSNPVNNQLCVILHVNALTADRVRTHIYVCTLLIPCSQRTLAHRF